MDQRQDPATEFEAEVLPGLAPFAAAELAGLAGLVNEPQAAGPQATGRTAVGESSIGFRYDGPRAALVELRRCVAVYELLRFAVPRPKALLGHQHLTRLSDLMGRLQAGPPAQEFAGFRFGAAGSDSPVFGRLAAALEEATGIPYRSADGELLLRFRPGDGGGWAVLGRLTPRPLSARAWRQCNRPGGLNATVAVVANELLECAPGDRYLNLMCGSGTLLVERGLAGGWTRGVGIDRDPEALACASANLTGAGLSGRAELLTGDALTLPFVPHSFDRLSVDLPWGDAVGDHHDNALLYPPFLAEAARVAKAGARLLVITHELRLLESALTAQRRWRPAPTHQDGPVRVYHGGHRPGLYLLERSAAD